MVGVSVVYDGCIGRFRLVAFLVDSEELEKYSDIARKLALEYFKTYLRGVLGLSNEEFDELVKKIESGEKNCIRYNKRIWSGFEFLAHRC